MGRTGKEASSGRNLQPKKKITGESNVRGGKREVSGNMETRQQVGDIIKVEKQGSGGTEEGGVKCTVVGRERWQWIGAG